MELTIIMPCYNEEDSIQKCIEQAKSFLERENISGEILVINDGSTDSSPKIASAMGVWVQTIPHSGYGRAIREGILLAHGDYVIMGDCDGTYHFNQLMPFLRKFRAGYEIVIGNRINSSMEKGALSILHRFGAKFLSFIARKICRVNIQDYHCGLRGGKTSVLREMQLCTDGFEFATEMIMRSSGKRIGEVDIRYRRSTRKKDKSKLKPISDGIRHLKYILSYR